MRRMIFGCGYLGLPTAKRWNAVDDEVFAVTRTTARFGELTAAGLKPRVGDVTKPSTLAELPIVDTVLFAVGMDRTVSRDIRAVYVDGLKNVLDRLPDETGHLIYVSSTGVYGDFGGDWVDESSPTLPTRDGGKACLEAESVIRASRFAERATILRFAGIYGDRRIPKQAAVASGKWEALSSRGYLNLIHVEDGARIIAMIAEKQPLGETILVSDGQPVKRKQYYQTVADFMGTGPIQWPDRDETTSRGRNDKRVSNARLCRIIGDDFLYPDYHCGLLACCENQ